MTDYKHGDWYCKSANKTEAKEIIERAIASGAVNKDGLRGNSIRSVYGVSNGNVVYGFSLGTEYTIAELRQKFPLPGGSVEPKQWNGEGLPPVGVECEMKSGDDWIRSMLIGFDGDAPIFKLHKIIDKVTTTIKYMPCYSCTFRPLRTEREKWVEDFVRLSLDTVERRNIVPETLAGAIYDAIKSGKLKAPEVE